MTTLTTPTATTFTVSDPADVLAGVDGRYLLTKILEAVDRGVPTDEIRRDPLKFLTSGKTKEIIINTADEYGVMLTTGDCHGSRGSGDRTDPVVIEIIKAGRLEIPGQDPIILRCFKDITSVDEAQGLTVVRVPEEDTCYKIAYDLERDRELILGPHEFVATTDRLCY